MAKKLDEVEALPVLLLWKLPDPRLLDAAPSDKADVALCNNLGPPEEGCPLPKAAIEELPDCCGRIVPEEAQGTGEDDSCELKLESAS